MSSLLLLHNFVITAECSALMLHLTDIYCYAGMVMKDAFIIITSFGIGKTHGDEG